MKKFLLLAVLAVSASAFAATDAASLVGELQALDAEYQNLANQEEARFNEERAQADAARQKAVISDFEKIQALRAGN